MKAKLIIDNTELEVEITEEELEKLRAEPKHTGYERVKKYDSYYAVDHIGRIYEHTDNDDYYDQNRYYNVNYYSTEEIATNNARADKLMRQLRRFAVEHRENSTRTQWHEIYYDSHCNECKISKWSEPAIYLGSIAFDTKETAQLARDTFNDELIWYFTEYKDSL